LWNALSAQPISETGNIMEFSRKFENRAEKFAVGIIPLSIAFPIHPKAWLSGVRLSLFMYFSFSHLKLRIQDY
jgi:hypothetical protein